MTEDQKRLALLIDADNVSHTRARDLIEELTTFGALTVRRAYGDWSSQQLEGWRKKLHVNAITPVQQFANTKGKNASDSALIIDAMDLLYSGALDGFVICSSDSDFTRLATRLRESGKVVYGVGEKKTPEAFVEACDRFLYLENLGAADASDAADAEDQPPIADITDDAAVPKLSTGRLQSLVHRTLNQTARDDGWSSLSGLGSQLVNANPSFDPRTYGFAKLSDLIESLPFVETKRESDGPGRGQIWARPK